MVGLTPASRRRLLTSAFATLLVAGCTVSTGGKDPKPGREVPGAQAPGARRDQAVTLSPAEALSPQAQGVRVRWSGGIRSVDAREGGRECFTVLQSTFDAQGYLRWPAVAQTFVACGPGEYDRTLLAPFVLASFEGTIAGRETVLGVPVPVLEIEALHRHSDCLQGSEASPECFSGPMFPRRP